MIIIFEVILIFEEKLVLSPTFSILEIVLGKLLEQNYNPKSSYPLFFFHFGEVIEDALMLWVSHRGFHAVWVPPQRLPCYWWYTPAASSRSASAEALFGR